MNDSWNGECDSWSSREKMSHSVGVVVTTETLFVLQSGASSLIDDLWHTNWQQMSLILSSLFIELNRQCTLKCVFWAVI